MMYRKSVITFLDILGFQNLIEKSDFDSIFRKLEKYRKISEVDNREDGNGYEPKVFQFSDSTIRIRPLDSEVNLNFPYGLLINELMDLVILQAELFRHRILIRGGVTIGDIHFDDNSAFGPGFNTAYNLESDHANFPRIVIDPLLIQESITNKYLNSRGDRSGFDISLKNSLVRRELDGVYFIDYLRGVRTVMDYSDDLLEFYKKHKEIILSEISNVGILGRVSAKYLWLASYHNSVISNLEDETQRNFLEITANDAPLLASI